jgi:uncharacterized protein YjdB
MRETLRILLLISLLLLTVGNENSALAEYDYGHNVTEIYLADDGYMPTYLRFRLSDDSDIRYSADDSRVFRLGSNPYSSPSVWWTPHGFGTGNLEITSIEGDLLSNVPISVKKATEDPNLISQTDTEAELTRDAHKLTLLDKKLGTEVPVSFAYTDHPEIVNVVGKNQWKPLKLGTANLYSVTEDGRFVKTPIVITPKVVKAISFPHYPNKVVKVKPGQFFQVVVNTSPYDKDYIKSLIWSIDKPDIIKTISFGPTRTFKVLKAGAANITVTGKNGLKETLRVEVEPYQISKINITVPAVVNIGESGKYVHSVIPSNAQDKTVTWTSSHPSILSVDSNGKWLAKKAGSVVVTAKAKNGVTATTKVEVKTVYAKKLFINQDSGLVKIGDKGKLSVTINPNNTTNKKVKWIVTDPGILKIDANGNWQAVGEGFVAITAKALGVEKGDMLKDTIFFGVKPVLSSKVEILGEPKSTNVGKSGKLTAKITPSNTTNKKVTWKSSNTKVIKVYSNGQWKAVGKGKSSVTVTTSNGKKQTVTIQVK